MDSNKNGRRDEVINNLSNLKLGNWSQINFSHRQKSLEWSGAQYQNPCRVVVPEEEEEEEEE